MSVIIKKVDSSANLYGRSITLSSAAGDFVNEDIIDVNSSLGGPAVSLVIDVAAGSSCTFRVNSLNTRYPLDSIAKKLGIPAPDLSKGATWINTDAPTFSLSAGETMNVSDILPVLNIEFTALSGTVTVTMVS